MPLPISALLIAGFWLAWPWFAPHLSPMQPSSGIADLLGGAALHAALQRLLIRCPGQPVPAQALPGLLQGFDKATQITALAR